MLQDKNFQQTETLNHNTIILLVWEQVPGKHFALQILQFYARWVASLANFFPSLLGACLKAIILQIKFTISICTKIPKVELAEFSSIMMKFLLPGEFVSAKIL